MKKIALFGLLMVGFYGSANADDLMRARAGTSYNMFNTIFSGGDMKTNYMSLNLGGTYIMESGYFMDIGGRFSTSAKWNTSEVTEGAFSDEKYKRNDYTLTIGKAFAEGIQVFGGYQLSKSTINIPAAWNLATEEPLDVKGFFVGAGKSISIGDDSLNISAAIGKMSGKLINARGIEQKSSGGNGGSLNAVYTHHLSKSTALSLEAKYQKYKYTYDGTGMALTSGDDKMKSIGINLIGQF